MGCSTTTKKKKSRAFTFFFSLIFKTLFMGGEDLWWRPKDSYPMGHWLSAATLWDPETDLSLSGLHTGTALPTEPSHWNKISIFFFLMFVSSCLCSTSPSLKGFFFFLLLGFSSVQHKPHLPPSPCWDLVSPKEMQTSCFNCAAGALMAEGTLWQRKGCGVMTRVQESFPIPEFLGYREGSA